MKLDIQEAQNFNTKSQGSFGKELEPTNPDEERAYKNAYEVLSLIRDGTLEPSALKPPDRQPIVAYLRLEGHSIDEISQFLNVGVATVNRDVDVIRRDHVRVIKALSLSEVAGRIYTLGQHLSRKARREGNYATSWSIERQMIEVLQSLGFVYKAPKKVGVLALHADVQKGYDMLSQEVDVEKDKVIEALDKMLGVIKEKEDNTINVTPDGSK